MNLTAFTALVRRDLRLFFMDRRAVVMAFAAPILIASFFGYLFGGVSNSGAASKIKVAAVDEDASTVSRGIITALAGDQSLEVQIRALEEARESVRTGKTAVAIVFPKGFAEGAARALYRRDQPRPEVPLLYDPSHATEMQMVRGILTQHVMEAVTTESMSAKSVDDSLRELDKTAEMDPADKTALRNMLTEIQKWSRRSPAGPARSGFNMPYTVRDEAVTAHKGTPYNSMAHSFAGMCVQFILFMGIDTGMVMLYQRRSGLWKRLRAAPLSRFVLIGSRAVSSALIAMIIMLAVFGFARVVFGVRIEGSFAGMAGVCAAFALMTAAFGLLVSVVGKTPEATRGIAILVTLILVMLGGSWVPTFIFPQWLQNATFAVPTRWAVDGLDAMIWRGLPFGAAVGPIAAMLGFAAAFGAVAVWRFRWEA
ncbi:MAG TPA: ABC transporter permease [Candidatus Acidoferrales bacterium]|nr:ABC transporter permease [Candidatus Acidoferrales bacterium]